MSAPRWTIVALVLLVSACSTTSRVWYGHSPDRTHRVEVVEKEGHQHVRIDGEPSGRYLGVALESIAFSEDSQRLAYAAHTEAGWIVVSDGGASQVWMGIGEVRFGPGGRLAYVAADSGGWRVVLDGKPGPLYEAVMEGSLAFSPEGRRLAFVITDDEGFRVVVDGTSGPRYEAVGALRFGPEGERLAYVARQKGRPYLVIDDRVMGPFHALADFTLGPNGRLGMVVRDEDGWRAVVDGEKSDTFDSIGGIHFSPGGRHAYAARLAGSWFVLGDGERRGPYDGIAQLAFAGETIVYEARRGSEYYVIEGGNRSTPMTEVGRLTISPDGQHLAYVAASLRRTISVIHDGRAYPLPHALDGTLALSDDGLHWACLAVDEERGNVVIVIDGERRRPFDVEEMMAGVMLRPDASAGRHEEMIRRWVKAELDAALTDGPEFEAR